MTVKHETSNELVKGLFFGVVLGLGLAWYLSTPEGEKFKKRVSDEGGELLNRAREALDAKVSERIDEEDV